MVLSPLCVATVYVYCAPLCVATVYVYCGPLVSETSTFMVDRVGQILFAIYQVTVTIVLVNMLIAMMSHSFEAIQVRHLTQPLCVMTCTNMYRYMGLCMIKMVTCQMCS